MRTRPDMQRGVAALMAVLFLLFMLGVVLVIANQMAATDVHDSGAQNLSVEALFLAESAVERAAWRYSNGVACGAGLVETLTNPFSSGANTSFAVLASPVPVLVAGLCRLSARGVIGNVTRTIVVDLQQGGVVTYIGSNVDTAGGGAVTSLTITKPTGVVAGDVMLAQIDVRGGSLVTFSTVPTGWALVTNGRINSTTILAQAVYYKVAGGAEPASYTWGFTNGRAGGGIAAFRGVDNAAPINASSGQANASSTNIVAPSITTTVANTMLVGLFGTAQSDTITPPALHSVGIPSTASGAGPNGATIESAYVTRAAVGATGSRTATSTSAAVNIGHSVALRPGTGGSTSVVTWTEL